MYIIHTKDGTKRFTRSEIINNAIEQKKEGVKPSYLYRGYDKAGYLVASTWKDGAIVVVLASDYSDINNDHIFHAFQGEFIYH